MSRCVLAILFLLGMSLPSQGGDRDVVFTVPNDFHGFILLLEDPEKGIGVPINTPILSIPPTGVLRVRSFLFFPKDSFTEVPRRADGTPIPTYFKQTIDPTKTYFRSLGSNTAKDRMFFVGTGAECDAFQSNPLKAIDLKIEALKKEANASPAPK